jgi:hypothetical protein
MEISISLKYSQQYATYSPSVSINCGFSAHHQEHKTVHTASGIVKPILLPAVMVDELELRSISSTITAVYGNK